MIYANQDVSNLNYIDLKYKDSASIFEHIDLTEYGYTEQSTAFGSVNPDGDHLKFADTIFKKYSMFCLKQPPGCCLPEHTDAFYSFCKKYNVKKEDVVRLIFFMEDWKSGHYLEIESNPVVKWKAGDCVMIPADVPHLSGNVGLAPKYTMQITGLKSDLLI